MIAAFNSSKLRHDDDASGMSNSHKLCVAASDNYKYFLFVLVMLIIVGEKAIFYFINLLRPAVA